MSSTPGNSLSVSTTSTVDTTQSPSSTVVMETTLLPTVTPPALSELVVYEIEANVTVIAELSNLSSTAVQQLAGNLAALYEEGVRILLQQIVGRTRRQLMGSYSMVTVSVV